MRLYTIGFTKKSAETFFSLLLDNNVKCVVDIRVHPNSQLSGFAKRDDLPYLLKKLAKCEYIHIDSLCPTEEILSDYRKDQDWDRYVGRFEALMDARDIPHSLDRRLFEKKDCCLLCSEATPEQCHRRLVAERLAKHWEGTEINHLV